MDSSGLGLVVGVRPGLSAKDIVSLGECADGPANITWLRLSGLESVLPSLVVHICLSDVYCLALLLFVGSCSAYVVCPRASDNKLLVVWLMHIRLALDAFSFSDWFFTRLLLR